MINLKSSKIWMIFSYFSNLFYLILSFTIHRKYGGLISANLSHLLVNFIFVYSIIDSTKCLSKSYLYQINGIISISNMPEEKNKFMNTLYKIFCQLPFLMHIDIFKFNLLLK